MLSKGEETRTRILQEAVRLASRDGLGGLTIGTLATELGLSKSGLFAHFGSKDALQVQVLQTAVSRFQDVVVRPALRAPRGEPRLRAVFERWLSWDQDPSMPGGCLLITASIEFDDQPGGQHDFLAAAQRDWLASLAKMARMGSEIGHFQPDLDGEQLAFEFYALILGYHHARRLLRDPQAETRVRRAFERLLAAARI